MSDYSPEIIKITTLTAAKQTLQSIDVDPKSIDIMAPKTIIKHIKIHNITTQDAIIIKQDMLSIGGEVAIPKNTFYLKNDPVTILIFGTITQLTILTQKLSRHYPRLQNIASELSQILSTIH